MNPKTGRKAIQKNKLIKIYHHTRERDDVSGDIIDSKEYLTSHPLWASVKQAGTGNTINGETIYDLSSIEVVINYRSGIQKGDFIEYNGKTYAITAVDNLTFENTELKIRGEMAPDPTNYEEE